MDVTIAEAHLSLFLCALAGGPFCAGLGHEATRYIPPKADLRVHAADAASDA